MVELKRCPFCGSDEVGCWAQYGEFPNRKTPHTVLCEECGASTDMHPSAEEAIEAWNRRYEPKEELEFDYGAEV